MPEARSQSPESRYDAVIVGASLAGCAAAIQLGRGGSRVALVEKRPERDAFKRICSHFIQASAAPAIERLGLMEPIMAAGGLRSPFRIWTRWGWIVPPDNSGGYAVNLRRERLDPLIRDMAASTPGVELMLGHSAERLIREGGACRGVAVRTPAGEETELRAPLTIGADGRDSRVAALGDLDKKTMPHGRFAYGGYFENADPSWAPAAAAWMMDPQWGAAFPTDNGLTFFAAMLTKDRLPEFKADPEAALTSFISNLPGAPTIRPEQRVDTVLGKIDMTNRIRTTTAPGLALIGDAALTVDPLFGVGCGWALQSAEWLARSVDPALHGEEPLERGLRRYRRLHRRKLTGHAFLINDYATGRKMSPVERLLFSAAARDRRVARDFVLVGTRRVPPERMMPTMVPRALAVNTRYALAHRGGRQPTTPVAAA